MLPSDSYLWVLARRKDFNGWWPQGGGTVPVDDNRWKVSVNFGGPQDAGHDFEIAALVVRQPTHELWTDWVARAKETGLFSAGAVARPGIRPRRGISNRYEGALNPLHVSTTACLGANSITVRLNLRRQ